MDKMLMNIRQRLRERLYGLLYNNDATADVSLIRDAFAEIERLDRCNDQARVHLDRARAELNLRTS
jgi:hypothetical protein